MEQHSDFIKQKQIEADFVSLWEKQGEMYTGNSELTGKQFVTVGSKFMIRADYVKWRFETE